MLAGSLHAMSCIPSSVSVSSACMRWSDVICSSLKSHLDVLRKSGKQDGVQRSLFYLNVALWRMEERFKRSIFTASVGYSIDVNEEASSTSLHDTMTLRSSSCPRKFANVLLLVVFHFRLISSFVECVCCMYLNEHQSFAGHYYFLASSRTRHVQTAS